MANEPGKAVPETILKKRKRDEEWAAKKAAKSSETRKYAKDKRSVIFKKAEQYVKEYRQQARVLRLKPTTCHRAVPGFASAAERIDS